MEELHAAVLVDIYIRYNLEDACAALALNKKKVLNLIGNVY